MSSSDFSVPASAVAASSVAPGWIALVREKIPGLRCGVVRRTVHDGRVTQLKRSEGTRLPDARDGL